MPGRDFKKLNKDAIITGATTCKNIADYRSTHDARLKLGSDKVVVPLPYDASTSFGRPTNASTSFNDLFSHSYRYDWVSESTSAADVAATAASTTSTAWLQRALEPLHLKHLGSRARVETVGP